MSIEIKVPDIGDFSDVPVIEILVKVGDAIKPEDPLVVLESDKATLEIPAPQAGVVKELKVKVGDRVGEGAVLLLLEGAEAARAEAARITPPAAESPRASESPRANLSAPLAPEVEALGADIAAQVHAEVHAEVLVLGAGPGGYTAAFRAADLGAKVVLVERWNVLGGVCLNVGCIPSKALLHAAKVVDDAQDMAGHGISFGAPKVDLDKLRDWKKSVVQRLTGGLAAMAKQRKVTVVAGLGVFSSPSTLEVTAQDGSKKVIAFDKAIIAAGSEPVTLPFIPHDDRRVIDSTGALALADIPKKLLVLGGGIIGLEMATVYAALGSKVTIVELMEQIIPGADKDIVAPLAKRLAQKTEKILLKTKVAAVKAEAGGLRVTMEADGATSEDTFDKLLVAVGRKPNGKRIGAEKAGVAVDERGFIAVDKQMRTNVPHIFAIGDVVGQPMLAHKATHEAKVAAEVACGHKSVFDAKVIPCVAYTDPEVAWVGVTENEAKAKGLKFGKAVFPWAASGRALSLGRDEGVTKAIFDEESKRLIGVGIVGVGAGDLIAEAALAIEMGADAEDIGLTIHPHPTLSETIGMAAELFEGTITDLIPPKKKK